MPMSYFPNATYDIEADVVPGLEPFARDEISARLGKHLQHLAIPSEGTLTFDYSGDLRELLKLRSVVAIYMVNHYPVPRPKALLGHQYFTSVLATIETVLKLHPDGTFRTIRISAAGEESAVLHRLREELAAHFGLIPITDEADLLLRLRNASPHLNPLLRGGEGDNGPHPNPLLRWGEGEINTNSKLKAQNSELAEGGWEVLTRISPRPLVTRAWRVSNMPGALNATVAYAMAKLTKPQADDVFLNLACGSGSLLIERLAMVRAHLALGCDIDRAALNHAAANLAAFQYGESAVLGEWDATHLPLKSRSVNALGADLPFGALIGSHAENEQLYPALLREAARVARSGSRFVALTHEIRLMEKVLAEQGKLWRLERTIRVKFGGLTPGIYLLRRT